MLTGELPLKPKTSSFEGWFQSHHYQTPKAFNEVRAKLDLPQELMDLVNQCMAKAATQRPNSVNEILRILEQINQETSVRLPPVVPNKSKTFATADEICHQSIWPKDKPRAEIVFPELIEHQGKQLLTLWIMLAREDIEKYKNNKPHCQFLFVASPHPMLLWLTTLYQDEKQHRMLPCYLDLKKIIGQKILQVLTETSTYRLVLFALEDSEKCVCVITGTLVSKKIKLLKEWQLESKNIPDNYSQIRDSKRQLKEELDTLKPKLISSLKRQIAKK